MRGVSANVIYLEEAAYISEKVFFEVVLPLMSVDRTSTIGISTPAGSDNYYSVLTEAKKSNGSQLFNVVKVSMACERCMGTDNESTCAHPSTTRPPWLKSDDFEKVKAIYGDRETDMRRELMGQITDDENVAFDTEALKWARTRPAYHEPHEAVTHVYMAVDPNGGRSAQASGTGSESAIVSFFFDGANVVVRFSGGERGGALVIGWRRQRDHGGGARER